MELYKDILCRLLQNTHIEVTFQGLTPASDFLGGVCYRTLKQIKAVLEDASLNDPECFAKIEQIIEIFEEFGSRISGRHDYG